jgi:hypothetical protein
MIDRAIFESLQTKIDEEAAVRDVRPSQHSTTQQQHNTTNQRLIPLQELHEIVQTLSRKGLTSMSILNSQKGES